MASRLQFNPVGRHGKQFAGAYLRTLHSFRAWQFVAAAILITQPAFGAGGAGFFQNCAEVFRIWIQSDAITQARINEFLPQFHKEHADTWGTLIPQPPEAASGLTTEQALALLNGLNGKTGLTWGATKVVNPAWGNTTWFIPVNGAKVILKSNQQRTAVTGDKVVTFNNNVRYEVLAFALDRYLGTNLVPPAVMLDSGRAAILYTPGTATSFASYACSPRSLVHATHIKFIDALVSNGDREAPGNLVVSSLGYPVAIDFDLSRPYYLWQGFTGGMDYVTRGMMLDPARRFGKSGPISGVASRRVVEKLEKLDEATLVKIAGDAGLGLSKNEIANVLGSAKYLLYSLSQWEKQFGEANVYVP